MQQQQLNGNLPSAILLYWCHMFQLREMIVQEGNECPVNIISSSIILGNLSRI